MSTHGAARRADAERALWPPPRSIEVAEDSALEFDGLALDAPDAWSGALAPAWARVEHAAGASGGARAIVRVTHDAAHDGPAEGYALSVHARGIDVTARTIDGARHALATLAQLVLHAVRAAPPGARPRLPALEIEDAPDFAERGVMLDVSRTRVPTVATLEAFVERLAALKFNRLQLYTEHTFAYRGHAEVWRDASAYTGEEIEALDRFCAARGIELVPNQQSFGHMHRWLAHDRYRPLAEVPDGLEHAFSIHKEPYSLCPLDPGALALLADLYDQLLPHFTSRSFNVGLDETFDLGLGRSKEECARRGKHVVYVEFLRRVHALVAARGRRMQFWGDIVVEAPELVPELPRDAVAMEWGYERGHPFDAHAALFAKSGLEFHLCPGTSSWQSVLGRVDNMLENVFSAARAGREHGARGLLVTDWGDRGHLQPWSVSWPGIVTAAGAAWNGARAAERTAPDGGELAELLDAHVFADGTGALGRALLALGRSGAASGARSTNGSPLFFLLAFAPQGLPHPRIEGLSIEGLERAEEHVERARTALARARPECVDGESVLRELDWGARLLRCACRFGAARLGTPGGSDVARLDARERARLRGDLEALVAEHARVWDLRHRPGGRAESAGWLERVAALL
ncbi:MAG: family 20 glycosylhydrolase [Planctomycetes bacterium]|nr:family 20 glycosylhydrolase [Planctomycetota bacterium]